MYIKLNRCKETKSCKIFWTVASYLKFVTPQNVKKNK